MPFYDSSRRPDRPENFTRLQFLLDIINARGLNNPGVASILGITEAAAGSIFRVDDILLSKALFLAESLGFTVRFHLYPAGGDENVRYRVDPMREIIERDGQFLTKRLSFLFAAIDNNGLTQAEFASRMGLALSTVVAWRVNDDIKVSRIFQAADVLGMSIKITIQNIQQETPEKGSRICSIEFTNKSVHGL